MTTANDLIHIAAPASKSLSHRAVIAAALSEGKSRLTGVLQSVDLDRTMDCLRACGATIVRNSDGSVEVTGVSGTPRGGESKPADLDVHESGTTCRLMTGVVAAGRGSFRIHGAPRMHERPIGALAQVLENLGSVFVWEGQKGFPPFVLSTSGVSGGSVNVDAGESSQYVSGLLLAAACGAETTRLGLSGEKVVSWPYVALTLQIMEDFGVPVEVEECDENGNFVACDWRSITHAVPGKTCFVVKPGRYQSRDAAVEGDWSNASYFLAAGATGKRAIELSGLRQDSLQGDRAILDILEEMGAEVSWSENGVKVGPPKNGALRGVTVDMAACPDIVPTVAVVAAQASSRTVISGAAHLRIKECDRIEAMHSQLSKVGAKVQATDDGLIIDPAPLTPGPVDMKSFGDHRIPMSLSILENAGIQPRFDTPECVSKSFPTFWEMWENVR